MVTTPTGDIGRKVLERVLDTGEAVRVIARDPARLPEHVTARAEVVQGSHGDAGVITKALMGADRLFWLVPPSFSYPGSAEQYYLDFTRPACAAVSGLGVGVVGVTTLGRVPRQGWDAVGRAGDGRADRGHRRRLPGRRRGGGAPPRPFLGRPGQRPVVSPGNLTPDDMAEVISGTLGRTTRYRQVPPADSQAGMLRRGASDAMAQDMAAMTKAQNNGIYDAEPRDPSSAAPTSFRQWCQDILKPAVQAA